MTKTIELNLLSYVSKEILEGDDEGLAPDTPLLEWGVLNSMEMTRLTAFIDREFHLKIPSDEIVPNNFLTIRTIASMIERLRQSRPT